MKLLNSLVLVSAVLLTSVPLYATPIKTSSLTSSSVPKPAAININHADLQTLSSLPGIGKSKALAIVEYRKKIGTFVEISEIKNVKGIGEKLFTKLESKITVK